MGHAAFGCPRRIEKRDARGTMAGKRKDDKQQSYRYTASYHDERLEEQKAANKGLRRILIVLIVVLLAFLAASICIAFAMSSRTGDGMHGGAGTQTQAGDARNATSANADGEDKRTAVSDSDNRTRPGRKVCYLTFDDGPSENTRKILDILARYDVKATWFVIGTSGHLDYAKDIWAAGHQIGLHTWDHEYDVVYASDAAFWNSIEKIGDAVAAEIGTKPTLIRFPGGSVNDYNRSLYQQLCTEAGEKGYHYFDWNVSSGDASPRGLSADEIYGNVTGNAADKNSACVLMHDTEAKGTTVEALPRMIEWFKANGYEFDVLQADSFGYHYWPVDEG